MKKFPESLSNKIQLREDNNALRMLPLPNDLIDFSSNDYLGFAKNLEIFNNTHQYLIDNNIKINGATGSRLLTGNHKVYQETERFLAQFHKVERALIYNSGYDANVGFFSVVPQKQDVILYDELCHASIRDGILMSRAKAFKFKHNNVKNLEKLIVKQQSETEKAKPTTIYIVTESVFSMNGDIPDFEEIISLTNNYNAYLIVDEAHALGIIGEKGEGVIQSLGLEKHVFARIITFGKALGCHGAAILCSLELKMYLINFSRSFIYTTGLSPHSVATILISYQFMIEENDRVEKLNKNILFFNETLQKLIPNETTNHQTPIQFVLISGNEKVKKIALELQSNGFDVKPILSPTVPKGKERLRFCLHSYNTENQISEVLELLSSLVISPRI